jgi:hypothetical protein
MSDRGSFSQMTGMRSGYLRAGGGGGGRHGGEAREEQRGRAPQGAVAAQGGRAAVGATTNPSTRFRERARPARAGASWPALVRRGMLGRRCAVAWAVMASAAALASALRTQGMLPWVASSHNCHAEGRLHAHFSRIRAASAERLSKGWSCLYANSDGLIVSCSAAVDTRRECGAEELAGCSSDCLTHQALRAGGAQPGARPPRSVAWRECSLAAL